MSENNQNLFEKTSDAIETTKTKAKNTFKNFISYISYIIIIAVTIFFSLAYIGFTNEITWDVILQAGILLAINLSSMAIFEIQGEDNEKQKSKTYSSNLTVWGDRVAIIENNKLVMTFREYCKKRTDLLREEIRQGYIHSAGLDIEFYEKHIKDLPLKQLKQLKIQLDKRNNEKKFSIKDEDLQLLVLTNKDYRFIKKAHGEIKVNPISYAKVLAGATCGKTNNAIQEHKGSYKSRSFGFKGFSVVFLAIITVVASILPTGASGFQAVLDILWRIFGVTISTIMGFYTGIKAIRIENSDNKEKILFIDEFLEEEKVDINSK